MVDWWCVIHKRIIHNSSTTICNCASAHNVQRASYDTCMTSPYIRTPDTPSYKSLPKNTPTHSNPSPPQYALEALELDPTTFGAVVSKALQAAKAAAAAKQARELVRRKNVLTKSTLPGKLADCTGSDKASSEIFIVEGDSAGVLCWDVVV